MLRRWYNTARPMALSMACWLCLYIRHLVYWDFLDTLCIVTSLNKQITYANKTLLFNLGGETSEKHGIRKSRDFEVGGLPAVEFKHFFVVFCLFSLFPDFWDNTLYTVGLKRFLLFHHSLVSHHFSSGTITVLTEASVASPIHFP
jgi:hypothetical protein